MIRFTQGNLLDADAEALVNTVNTVGVMGKGIALMFKEAFPENFRSYEAACKAGAVRIGSMYVTERRKMIGPKWIINFPTKEHWRQPSQMEWIDEGLQDLKHVIVEKNIRSVAIPPLGSGNGGLDWAGVKRRIEMALEPLRDVSVIVYEPTATYQNVAKRAGVETMTPARALVAELVRRYSILGIECTLLEVHKLAYFLERSIETLCLRNELDLKFEANRFGPYSQRLAHLLNGLDGSYLHCDRRLADARPLDSIRFDDARKDKVSLFLASGQAKAYLPALKATTDLIDGFESPLGMELLATVDWMIRYQNVSPTAEGVAQGLRNWPGGVDAAKRKMSLFTDRMIGLALQQFSRTNWQTTPQKSLAAMD